MTECVPGYYNQMLDVRMSGQLFARGNCRKIPNRYAVTTCEFVPETLCWQDTSTVNITAQTPKLSIDIIELEIIS